MFGSFGHQAAHRRSDSLRPKAHDKYSVDSDHGELRKKEKHK
jgi:hypothetical protein